jgi:hypothetical protein
LANLYSAFYKKSVKKLFLKANDGRCPEMDLEGWYLSIVLTGRREVHLNSF